MRFTHRSLLSAPLALVIALALWTPHASAQANPPPVTECPEGLVYDEPDDICLLPENIPDDQTAAPPDDTQPPPPTETPPGDGQSMAGDDQLPSATEDQPAESEPDGAMEAPTGARQAADPDPRIRNLTLLTFACPVNWNPATRPIEDSREMCTEPIVPAMSYTILFEGTEMVTAGLGTDVDLAADLGLNGVPLPAGMWTIRENLQEGLDDPFAFCAIHAADGTPRLTVAETVPGGELDILLAGNEEVNCEWYSVATVPEVSGDPNALPIGGLTVQGYFCPFRTEHSGGLEHLVSVCTEGGLNGVEFTASRSGVVESTQPGPASAAPVDFQAGLDTRLLSGTWTLSATPAPGYDETFIFCTITTEAGAVRNVDPETALGSIELELQPGESGHCRWFNVEAEPRPGPSLGIEILLNTCPEEFDHASGDLSACTLPLSAPVTVEFVRDGQVVERGTAPAGATELRFTGNGGRPEAGTWTIRPILPDGWVEPYFTCNAVDSDGNVNLRVNASPRADGGPGGTVTFGPHHLLQCNLWIYTVDVASSVIVVTRYCPDDVDATNPAAGDRMAACRGVQARSIVYTIDDAAPVETESGRTGMAVVPAQPGQWRISVDLSPENRAIALVTCDHMQAALGVVQTIEPTINADGISITIDLDDGDALRCDVFDRQASAEMPPVGEESPEPGGALPEDDETAVASEQAGAAEQLDPGDTTEPTGATLSEGTFGGGSEPGDAPVESPDASSVDASAAGDVSMLYIQHWDCPEPVADTVLEDLAQRCTASLEPRDWQLNGEPPDVFLGYAVWEGLPLGTATVSNPTAAGLDDAASAVYCTTAISAEGTLVATEVQVTNGAIEVVFDQPVDVYCAWFLGP